MPASMAFVALGTRGDVQPLALLASEVQQCHPEIRCHLITHASHQDWMAAFLAAGVQLHALAAAPARAWASVTAIPSAESTSPYTPNGSRFEQRVAGNCERSFDDPELRQALLRACESALDRSLPAAPQRGGSSHIEPAGQRAFKRPRTAKGASSSPSKASQPRNPPLHDPECAASMEGTVTPPPPGLIVFNLFSLEGLHIAEALRVPCVAVSPCLVPSAMPSGFERRFRAAHPRLYRHLNGAKIEGGVGWPEVEHWMWPAFTERWSTWREAALQLPPVYLDSAAPSQRPLPLPPLLLYTLSKLVNPRPGYWPASVRMTGILSHLNSQECDLEQQASLTVLVEQLKEGGRPLVCIDMGSIPRMGLLPDPAHFMRALSQGLKAAGCCGLMLTGGHIPWADLDSTPELTAVRESVPHSWLLPLCDAVLHAGGAGTTNASLLAGCPQLVCPLHFDQFSWAERVEWLGVGCALEDPQVLVGRAPIMSDNSQGEWSDTADAATVAAALAAAAQLTSALQRVLHSGCVSKAQQLGTQLRAESAGALSATADELVQIMASRQLESIPSPLHTAASQDVHTGDLPATMMQVVSHRVGYPTGEVSCASTLQGLSTAAEDLRGVVETNDTVSPGTLSVVTMPNGMRLQCGSPVEARFIYDEIFVQRCYSKHGIRVRTGDTVIDAGANVGLFTLFLLRGGALGRPGQVIAIEPMPSNLTALGANIDEHGFGSSTVVVPAALGNTECNADFTLYPLMPGNSTRHPAEKRKLQGHCMKSRWFDGASTVQCRVRTLSSVIDKMGLKIVHLLKVDVEGSELEVLQGIEDRHWGIVEQVVAEVHDGCTEATKDLLIGKGFRVTSVPSIPDCNWLIYAVKRS